MVAREFAIKTDEAIAEQQIVLFGAENAVNAASEYIQRNYGKKVPAPNARSRWDTVWEKPVDDLIAQFPNPDARLVGFIAELNAARDGVAAAKAEIGRLQTVWLENGQWNRAYLVTNANGHVHSTTACSTCFVTTQFVWLTEFSGADEAEIVDAAGETACTVCYPSAPAEVLNRPSSIVTQDQRERNAKRQQRQVAKAARDAERAAKAPTASGEPLVVRTHWFSARTDAYSTEQLKTERAARIWYTDQKASLLQFTFYTDEQRAVLSESLEMIVVALAEKHNIPADVIRTELDKKAAKKAI